MGDFYVTPNNGEQSELMNFAEFADSYMSTLTEDSFPLKIEQTYSLAIESIEDQYGLQILMSLPDIETQFERMLSGTLTYTDASSETGESEYTFDSGTSLMSWLMSLGEESLIAMFPMTVDFDPIVKISSGIAIVGDDYAVNSIGANAFEASGITSVTIPNSITMIGNEAFLACETLSEINIDIENSQLATIGDYAFAGCTALTSFNFPKNLTYAGYGILSGTENLSQLNYYSTNLISAYQAPPGWGQSGTSSTMMIGAGNGAMEVFIANNVESLSTGAFLMNQIGMYGNTLGHNGISALVFEENSSLKTIGNYAFTGNSGLTTITIPESVTSIGEYAFSDCNGFYVITIPHSVTSIGNNTFQNCYGLVEIINKSGVYFDVGSYGTSTYYNPILEVITDESDTKLFTINGNLYKDYNGERYFIKNIDDSTEIMIDSNTTHIYRYAFYNRSDINSIVIPAKVTSIEEYAFYNCHNLETVTLERDSQLTVIGRYAFYECNSLTSITIPEMMTDIADFAFYNTTALTEINFYATDMNDCDNYNKIFYKSGQDNPGIIVNISANVTRIPSRLFYVHDGWEESIAPKIITVNFEEGSECAEIGAYAFTECNNLTNINIPSNVATIGIYAFDGCSSLTTVTFGENSQLTSIGNHAFKSCSSLTSITIPEGVTSIGNSAFYMCINLIKITIPSSLTSIEERNYIFSGCYNLVEIVNKSSITLGGIDDGLDDQPILEIIVDESETKLITIDGNLYKDYNGERYFIKNMNGSTEITIDSSATQIYNRAFYNRSDITTVTIPEGVTSIGDWAFNGCNSLTDVYYGGDINDWVSISFGSYDANPLSYGENLYLNGDTTTPVTEISIDTATSIGAYSFCGWKGLTKVTIGDQVTSIGIYAFYNCSSLTTVTFGEGSQLESIGSYALSDCSSLTSITIPSSVTSIGDSAFFGCSSLTTVTFGDNSQLTSIGGSAFYGCSSLTTVTFGENSQLESIGTYAFYDCRSLTSITIPSGVTSIGRYAFSGCSKLTSVTFENTSGWYRTTSSTATSGTSVTVTNPTQNATYLKSTYSNYYWKRNA